MISKSEIRIPEARKKAEIRRLNQAPVAWRKRSAADGHCKVRCWISDFAIPAWVWCLVLLLSFELCALCFDTVFLTPSADTALLQAFPSNNFGAQAYFNSGTTQTYLTNRGLMKFDLAAALPAGAKITFAQLSLEVVGQPVDGDAPSSFQLRRMLRDWGEGTKKGNPPTLGATATAGEANWTHRLAQTTNTWAAPGGGEGIDFVTANSGEQYVYGINLSPYLFDATTNMLADLQSWLAQPETNFGWLLLSLSEAENFSARRFASREDMYRAPKLQVDFFTVKLDAISVTGGVAQLTFPMEPGWEYRVEFCDGLGAAAAGGWQSLVSLPAVEVPGTVTVTDTIGGGSRFYRLAVP